MSETSGVTSAGIRTRVGELFVREVGSGPPALLWHSLFVDSTTWHRVEGGLGAVRRLVLLDGPGHGRSPDPGRDYTLDDCAGAACDVLDRLGIEGPVDWLGNAWGGHVGVVFAATRPDRCRSLVTVGTPVHPLEPAVRRQTRASLPVYRALGPIRPFVRTLTHALVAPVPDPEDTAVVAAAFRRADRRGMARAMRCASLRRPDLTPRLPTVTAPTLMIAAADDRLWQPEQARAAVRAMSGAIARTVPGAGHVAPLLRSAGSVVELVTGFWADPVGAVARASTESTESPAG